MDCIACTMDPGQSGGFKHKTASMVKHARRFCLPHTAANDQR